MPQKKIPSEPRPPILDSREREQKTSTVFVSSSVNWEPEGYLQTVFSANLRVVHFCGRLGISEFLYEPDRLARRVPSGSVKKALPKGWGFVLDDWTEDLRRKRPLYNRQKMRQLCVRLKVPYWDLMQVGEMKAVIVRWAIAEEVPETDL